MRALVTGARGFLGGHLVRHLQRDHETSLFNGDVRDASAYEDLGEVDVAFHLAAISSVPVSVADPWKTWSVNAEGTLRLLEWARTADLDRLVLVSTAHVYGRPTYSPVDEAHPTRPVSPYGASKLAAEAMARAYEATYGLNVTIVRPFNIYGPGQAAGFLVPDILIPLVAGKAPRLGAPKPVRDFTFVEDAVRFLSLSGTVPAAAGMTLNLGSGEGHAVEDVARLAVEVSGVDVEPTFDTLKARVADADVLIVDNRLAMRTLDWKPTTAIEEGLRRTWRAMGAPTEP